MVYHRQGLPKTKKEAIPVMSCAPLMSCSRLTSKCKFPLTLIVAVLLLALLPGTIQASPPPMSGTPLIPPVPPASIGAIASMGQVQTVAFSLLGKSVAPLPLQEKFHVTLFSSGSGMREVTANLYYPKASDPPGPLNIYVEVGASVSQWQLTSLVQEFEQVIYPSIHEYFGTESDIDGNGQITLLITDLGADHVSGYFDARNQYSNKVVTNSNEREMVYINSRMLSYGLDVVLQALTHEFTHLVQWNYHWNYGPDNIWFTEGMAMYGSYVVGKVSGQTSRYWDFGSIHEYLRSYTNVSLVDWQQRYADYGAAYAYMLYLSEHYSPGHLRRLFQDPRTSRIDVVADYLAGYDTTLAAVLVDWAVANAFDLPDGRYGYSDLATGLNIASLPMLPQGPVALPAWGTRYLRLAGDGGQGMLVQIPAEPGLAARIVEQSPDGKWIVRKLEKVRNQLQYQRDPGTQVAESVLVLATTGSDARVEVGISTPTTPPLAKELEIVVLPDLLLVGRYAILIKASDQLDGPPLVEVTGIRGGDDIGIARAWPEQNMYLSNTFTKDKFGNGSIQVSVKGHKDGQEILTQRRVD